ncbi:MAG: RluA family pseudouridine synthase [Burkholderiales bacterium]
MKDLGKNAVTFVSVGEEGVAQRLDNYLFRALKGVPKSHVYRIVRSGEVRINGKRGKPTTRLSQGDELRIPPLRVGVANENTAVSKIPRAALPEVLHEDEFLLALNKPVGLAVHGGSGVSFGVIELCRTLRPELKFLELVHRLDRDTSGILLLAKKRAALLGMHTILREGLADKRYQVLVKGQWKNNKQSIKLSLSKYVTAEGERRVFVNKDGQDSHTIFRKLKSWPDFTLLEAELKTGRTHQIRVHLAHLGFPILGDEKYGDFGLNRELTKQGLKRMFLHAASLSFVHPSTQVELRLTALLPVELSRFIAQLDAAV